MNFHCSTQTATVSNSCTTVIFAATTDAATYVADDAATAASGQIPIIKPNRTKPKKNNILCETGKKIRSRGTIFVLAVFFSLLI